LYPVNLVGQNKIGKKRTLMNGELAILGIIDLGTNQVGGQQVGRKLNAGEIGLNCLSHSFHQQSLGQAGHTFQQNMAIGQKRDQNALNQRFLADHYLVDFGQKVLQKDGLAANLLIELSNSCSVHY
jgi:hypothetical protein